MALALLKHFGCGKAESAGRDPSVNRVPTLRTLSASIGLGRLRGPERNQANVAKPAVPIRSCADPDPVRRFGCKRTYGCSDSRGYDSARRVTGES